MPKKTLFTRQGHLVAMQIMAEVKVEVAHGATYIRRVKKIEALTLETADLPTGNTGFF